MLKHCTLALVLASVLALPNVAAAQAAAGKPEQALIQGEKDRFAAMVKADEATLNRLLSDDLTYIHASALLQTKKEFIDSLKTGVIDYISVTPVESDWHVRIAGGIAIVTGAAAVHVVDHGTDLNFRIRYTSVHTNRAGAWQMINWQATKFPQ
jgi:Domain of unknown function (DUF4440)